MMNTGINTEAIEKLCLDVQDYASKIKNTLSQIDDVVQNATTSFSGDGYSEFRNKFLVLKESFPVIYENISSYIDEFNILRSNYENLDVELSNKLQISAENVMERREIYYGNDNER